jgi:hypothetical protein
MTRTNPRPTFAYGPAVPTLIRVFASKTGAGAGQ